MKRTIIDILQKGNHELFHSAMVAWLLNPAGEHELGDKFLMLFAEKVGGDTGDKLRQALNLQTPQIETEFVEKRGRYDILLCFGELKFVIENKIKSVGNEIQTEAYEERGAKVIALGFSDASFSEETSRECPVVTYSEVLEILEKLLGTVAENVFVSFISHYRDYLRRELGLLNNVETCYVSSDSGYDEGLDRQIQQLYRDRMEARLYTENDGRFLNFYFLEHFRRRLARAFSFEDTEWKIDKNILSGVGLWWFCRDPDGYLFNHKPLLKTWREKGIDVFCYIELNEGILAQNLDDTSGNMQLRCCANPDKKLEIADVNQFIREIQEWYSSKSGISIPKRRNLTKVPETFYAIWKPLKKREILFPNFEKEVCNFHSSLLR